MGLFSRKKHNNSASIDRTAIRLSLLEEALDEIDHADSPHSFFRAYNEAVKHCAEILSYKLGREIDNQMLGILHHLFGDKTDITNKFLKRSSSGGRLSYDIDAIIEHRCDMTDDSYDYFLSLTGLDELSYTYCTVNFGGSRTYDYICEIPDIAIGDDVIVPVGEEEIEKIARVIDINEYSYDEVPYPVAKTKKIIAKYGRGL